MYQQTVTKRQKKEMMSKNVEINENFPGLVKIEYRPEGTSDDIPYFRYYNPNELLHGRTMEEWLRPSIFVGHFFVPRPNTSPKPWTENNYCMQSLENYKRSYKALFEFCLKMGIKHWSAYDSDLAPEAESWDETQQNRENVADFLCEMQQRTGVRPLWIAPDLRRTVNYTYRKGAFTNPDALVSAFAGSQTKKCLDLALKLQSECFLLPTQQEGYEDIMMTDTQKELKHFQRFMKLMADYKEKIGYRGQLLMQGIKERRNYDHLYDSNYVDDKWYKYSFDANSALCFMKHYGLDRYYQLNLSPGHTFYIMSTIYKMQGSIEIKGKDLTDLNKATQTMRCLLEKGSPLKGGLNFHISDNNTICDTKEYAEKFITSLDVYAKALRIAAKFLNDNQYNKSIQMRYNSYLSGWGNRIENSEMSLDECEEQVKRSGGDFQNLMHKQEFSNFILLKYMDALHK